MNGSQIPSVDLTALLRPESIAILGASQRPSVGLSITQSLKVLGFSGPIYPINPKYDSIEGFNCYDSLAHLPAPPDVVAICLGKASSLDCVKQAAECGARAAVLYGAGFADEGHDGRKLQDQISQICFDSGIALLGPNCMGQLAPWDRASTYLSKLRTTEGLQGNVGLVSQSGSVCIGLLNDPRRFGFSHVISTGNEAVVTSAAVIDYLVDDPKTGVIAVFSESINDPKQFLRALDRAAEAEKPVVLLKAGKSGRAKRAIVSHTGGLAGAAPVLSAVLKEHRVIEVEGLDQMTEVLAALQGGHLPKGRRLGVLTASGGHAELILDQASPTSVDLPPLTDQTRAKIEAVTGPLTGDGNPTDFWGNGNYLKNLPHSLSVLEASEENDAIILCMDAFDHDPVDSRVQKQCFEFLTESAEGSEKPHYLLSTRPGVFDQKLARDLAYKGVATVSGTEQGLRAIDHLARYQSWAKPAPRKMSASPPLLPAALAERQTRKAINEFESKKILESLGLSVVPEAVVENWEDAASLAEAMGYPLVLKALSDDIVHKSENGLVALNLSSEAALRDAWLDLQEKLKGQGTAPLLLQKMIASGLEVFAGVSKDPTFGHVLAFGLGGTAIEIWQDMALRPLPLSHGAAAQMITEIRGAPLLNGYRGHQPCDKEALIQCLETLADFAQREADWIEEIDLNPIKLFAEGQGYCLVDALIVPSKTAASNIGSPR